MAPWIRRLPLVSNSLGILRDFTSFGGNGDGVTSNDAAWVEAMSSMGSKGCLYFPAGKYYFSAGISANLPGDVSSLSFVGEGPGASILYWPNPSAGLIVNLAIPMQSAHVRDLSFITGQAGTSIGLILVQTGQSLGAFEQSTIERVTFRGDDNIGNGGSKYWSNGYVVANLSGTAVKNVNIYGGSASPTALGVGAVYEGSSNSSYSIYHSLDSVVYNNLNISLQMGGFTQGIAVGKSNFQNSNIGFFIAPGVGGQLAQLMFSDTQFAVTGESMYLGTAIGGLKVHDCLFFVAAGAHGVNIVNGSEFSLRGNTFVTPGPGLGGTGVTVAGSALSDLGTIIGNNFSSLAKGVELTASSRNVNVQSNKYIFNTADTSNAGTNNTIGGGSP